MTGELPDEIYPNPNLVGYFLRVPWRRIEPKPGEYDWSVIDKSMRAARQNGKWVSIGIMAGNLSPAWLYEKGATKFVCTILPTGGAVETEVAITMPLPWDSVFLRYYTAMIQALSKHLKDDGTYDALAIIKINGINENTAEMRLPHVVGEEKHNSAGTASDTYPLWKAVGYRPSLVIEVFKRLCELYAAEFPDKVLSLPIIQPDWHAFPAIDETGAIIDKDREHTSSLMTAYAIERYGRRLQLQWNALSGTRKPPAVMNEFAAKGIPIAFQENIGATRVFIDRSKKQGKTHPYPDEIIRDMIDMGLSYHMEFIELFAVTIQTFPAAVEYGAEAFR